MMAVDNLKGLVADLKKTLQQKNSELERVSSKVEPLCG